MKMNQISKSTLVCTNLTLTRMMINVKTMAHEWTIELNNTSLV
jgi:hypothetical protein